MPNVCLLEKINMANASTDSLLNQLAAGDATAGERWLNMYGPLIYSWARQSGMEPEEVAHHLPSLAEEIVRAIQHQKEQPPSDSVPIRELIWRLLNERLAQEAAESGTTTHRVPNKAQEVWGGVVQRALCAAEAEFPAEVWEAFVRTTLEVESQEAVAQDLGWSVAKVHEARALVLQRLRFDLGGEI